MKRSVLIVDDNIADIEIARVRFEVDGTFEHVLGCTSAEEALSMFEHHERNAEEQPDAFPPALILLDINMPRVDGFEFLARLEAMGLVEVLRDTAIVMLSSSTLPGDRERALAHAIVRDYMIKPPGKSDVTYLAELVGLPT